MKRTLLAVVVLLSTMVSGCNHKRALPPALAAKANGTAIVVVSGDKQLGSIGSQLPQPLILQINDDQGNAVTGANVQLYGPPGVTFTPQQILTDDNGQATFKVTMGGINGRYELTASSQDAHGRTFSLTIPEFAAGYQQEVGYEVNQQYCSRCHNPDSTSEQVSNYDNLAVKPHRFSDGLIYNNISETDLTTIISHGGAAMNRSALMPPYGWTLNKAEVQGVIAYIRLVSDPPYVAPGVVYQKH